MQPDPASTVRLLNFGSGLIRMKFRIVLPLLAIVSLVIAPIAAPALTTNELVRLKNAGVSEDIIVMLVETGYQDVDKIVHLREAGFKDQTIAAIIRGETANNPSGERNTFETTARVRIEWYLMYRDKPVLQNSQTIDKARVYLVENTSLKLEWKEAGGLGLLDSVMKKAFKSPFYWTLNRNDLLEQGGDGYSTMLQSMTMHEGKPDSDGAHYWRMYLEPDDPAIVNSVRSSLQALKEKGTSP